ncbi:putative RNA helicase [Tieghemostelium lacteum]|uniref:ATP-dependent RNA helicase n=1 Tax=Tieghemostelium lacteum TaxID=361077 RepID=A0A151ZAK1_TIELA|nr:putative RNA helicase [Tieghemostelium lacteum]|eukprot:KYQ90973.1 putative RNA helicase [Tieghemostelium lacteum]
MSAFEDLGVLPEIIRAIEELDWVLPTPIQAEAIPLILGGGDVLAAAETGSGKTGAFALPILQITFETINGKAVVPESETQSTTTTSTSDSKIEVTWSNEDRDVDLAVDGYICQSRAKDWAGIKATRGVQAPGKYYYEATVRDEGLCRVGWALKQSSRNIGTDKFSFGYGGTGKKSTQSKFIDYGLPYGTNDTIGCLLNLDDGQISFSKNGHDFGEAFSLTITPTQVYYPALVMKNAEMGFNFGQEAFKHLPKGYVAINSAPKLISKEEDQSDGSTPTQPVNTNNNNNNNNNQKKSYQRQSKSDQKSDTAGSVEKKQKQKRQCKPISLIIEPVKELADQTYSAILNFSKYLTEPSGIEVSLCIGGQKTPDQSTDVDIIVGTPGRLEMLVKENKIDLSSIKFFVLDEADQLIQDNLAIINFIYNKLPKTSLQVLFFSATLHSPQVVKFCEQITRNPTWVDLKGRDYVPDLITHSYVMADPIKYASLWRSTSMQIKTDGVHREDVKHLPEKLKTDEQKSEAIKLVKGPLLLKCIDSFNMDQAIIFARTRVDCDNLYKYLLEAGSSKPGLENKYSCSVLHGEKSVDIRKENFEKFKQGDVKFLICTDVAARGIDIRELPYVINYTLPDSFEDYVHRVGRVGRADRIGLAISLVGSHPEKVWYHTCRDKGKGCFNTKLVEQKGCCIWYDELDLFSKINESLAPQLLSDDFKLPEQFDQKLQFGKFAKDKLNPMEYKPHTEELKSRVQELSHLEETIQIDFLTLPTISLVLQKKSTGMNIFKDYPVELIQNPNEGRYLISSRDLEVGEIILKCRSYFAVASDNMKKIACHNCLRMFNVIQLEHKCQNCLEVYWCTQECREQGENKHQIYECKYFKCLKKSTINKEKFDSETFTEIRMLVGMLGRYYYHRILGNPDTAEEDPDYLTNSLSDVFSLVENDISKKTNSLASELLDKISVYVNDLFNDVLHHRKLKKGGVLSEKEKLEFQELMSVVKPLAAKIRCNQFGIWSKNDKCIGVAVSPSSSYFNHSCIPNCVDIRDGKTMAFRALHPISKGTPLCISYLDIVSTYEQRYFDLLFSYFFKCRCLRCLDASSQTDQWIYKFTCQNPSCNGLYYHDREIHHENQLNGEIKNNDITLICTYCKHILTVDRIKYFENMPTINNIKMKNNHQLNLELELD